MKRLLNSFILCVLAMVYMGSVHAQLGPVRGEVTPGTYAPIKVDSFGKQITAGVPVQVMSTDSGDGRVTGTIANLAGSASTFIYFDLGPDWMYYNYVSVYIQSTGPSTGLGSIGVAGNDTPTSTGARYQNYAQATGNAVIFATLNTSTTHNVAQTRPFGRYLIIHVTNADATNAQGAGSRVVIAAYPH